MNPEKIILFDGVCNLCNGSVNFIIRRDPESKFKFASLQSEVGQKYLQKFSITDKELNSVILIDNEKYYLKSQAALRIVSELSTPLRYLSILHYIPRFIRDLCYDIIAKYRYRIWGKTKTCQLPDNIKQR